MHEIRLFERDTAKHPFKKLFKEIHKPLARSFHDVLFDPFSCHDVRIEAA